MIKDILAVVDNGGVAKTFLEKACRLAEEKDANLEVAVLTPAPISSGVLAPFDGFYAPDVVLLGDDAANLMSVRAVVDQAACKADVFGFHDDVAWLAGDIQRSRQVADLIVVGTADTWETPWLRRRVLETLIRSSGTPLLILPDKLPMGPIHRAILGWKASAEATRAMHALAAFAERGAAIDVVTVGMSLGECQRERNAHDEIKRHLGRHGFQAEGHWVVNDERIEADTLTLYAQEMNADVLVIGGSGHSRIRDIILGSVTRDLVSRSDLPTLIVG